MSVVLESGLGALLLRVPMVGPWHGPYPAPNTLLAEESGSEGSEVGEGGVSASAVTSAGGRWVWRGRSKSNKSGNAGFVLG